MDFLSSLVHISRSYLRLPMSPLEAEVRLCIVVLDADFFTSFVPFQFVAFQLGVEGMGQPCLRHCLCYEAEEARVCYYSGFLTADMAD